ncbi:MAG TPA: thiamine pyrophosphate-dependent enzyme, partial [Flavobacterium sp.]|nr:thiamine pyrophosphate-dependent enzyme [Flavobacterium sp.]
MDRFSFLNAAHTTFFADLYDQYLTSPDSVEPSWRSFFQGFDFANEYNGSPVEQLSNAYAGSNESSQAAEALQKEFAVLKLIDAYRTQGHLLTKSNPLKERSVATPDLSIEKFGLSQADLQASFEAAKSIQLPKSTLQQIVDRLIGTYCTTTGVEFTYIPNEEKVQRIAKYFESKNSDLTVEHQKHILEKLVQAAAFENFFHTKYVGQKRFSLEGLEATVPALDALIQAAAAKGVEDVVIGMAHRGRLNVLANIMQKPAKNIFTEFDGKDYVGVNETFDGDVKYHLGYTSQYKTPSSNIT